MKAGDAFNMLPEFEPPGVRPEVVYGLIGMAAALVAVLYTTLIR